MKSIKHILQITILAMLIFANTGCFLEDWFGGTEVGNPTSLTGDDDDQDGSTSPTTLAKGNDGSLNIEEQGANSIDGGTSVLDLQELIQNQPDLNQIWIELLPDSTAPTIDFTTSDVIVVSLGFRETTGYSVEITDYEISNSVVTVFVTETQPGDDCDILEENTNPYHIATLPRSNLTHTFELSTVVEDCE